MFELNPTAHLELKEVVEQEEAKKLRRENWH